MVGRPSRRFAGTMTKHTDSPAPILVLGGTGLTGRRVAEHLAAAGHVVRSASRTGATPFDWEDESTWAPALRGAAAAYLTYPVDLGLPGAADRVGALAALAVAGGTRRLVLLSGLGQQSHEPAERALRESGAAWTVLRASWFAQNLTEGFLADLVVDDVLAVPAADAAAAFVDLDDLAAVAATALTRDGHDGEVYELTGPRAVGFTEATAVLARATGRPVQYTAVEDSEFAAAVPGLPEDLVEVLLEVFTDLRSGTHEHPRDGVQRALGRAPRTLTEALSHPTVMPRQELA